MVMIKKEIILFLCLVVFCNGKALAFEGLTLKEAGWTPEQACANLARPGDIIIISNQLRNKDGSPNFSSFQQSLFRSFTDYAPATLADISNFSTPLQYAMHAGAIIEVSPKYHEFRDITYARGLSEDPVTEEKLRLQERLMGVRWSNFYSKKYREQNNSITKGGNLIYSIIRPIHTDDQYSLEEVFYRMAEFWNEERTSLWCSTGVDDIHQAHFTQGVGSVTSLQSTLGKIAITPTRMLEMTRTSVNQKAKLICQYNSEGQLLLPEKINIDDIRENWNELVEIRDALPDELGLRVSPSEVNRYDSSELIWDENENAYYVPFKMNFNRQIRELNQQVRVLLRSQSH